MSQPPLPPGTYRLAADVVNPEPDPRMRSWHTQPVIKAGTLLVSADFNIMDDRVERGLRSQDKLIFIRPQYPLYLALAPYLEPVVAERPSDLVARLGRLEHCRDVLDQLARDGKFTLEDVQAAYDAHRHAKEAR